MQKTLVCKKVYMYVARDHNEIRKQVLKYIRN